MARSVNNQHGSQERTAPASFPAPAETEDRLDHARLFGEVMFELDSEYSDTASSTSSDSNDTHPLHRANHTAVSMPQIPPRFRLPRAHDNRVNPFLGRTVPPSKTFAASIRTQLMNQPDEEQPQQCRLPDYESSSYGDIVDSARNESGGDDSFNCTTFFGPAAAATKAAAIAAGDWFRTFLRLTGRPKTSPSMISLSAVSSPTKQSKYRLTKTRITLCLVIILSAWLLCSITVAYQHAYFLDQLRMFGPSNAAELGLQLRKKTQVATSAVSVGPPLVRSSIPLPLPKQKVSVILMNYSRPRMIRESTMMRTLLSHPNIDEVLLLHSNSKTAFEFVHPKVVNIDAIEENEEMGLSLRFYFCQLAKNDWVIHLDDDMEFTTEALNEMLIEYGRNPRRIVGRFGRNLDLDSPYNTFNGYSSTNTHKSTEVVLTKLMVMERETCSAFFEYSHLLWDDVVLHDGEGPLWNGEDIFMSLVANHIYGPPSDGRPYNNYAMDWLDVWQADDSLKDYSNGKLDISGGLSGYMVWDWKWWQTLFRRNRHYSYRGRLWQTAKARLEAVNESR